MIYLVEFQICSFRFLVLQLHGELGNYWLAHFSVLQFSDSAAPSKNSLFIIMCVNDFSITRRVSVTSDYFFSVFFARSIRFGNFSSVHLAHLWHGSVRLFYYVFESSPWIQIHGVLRWSDHQDQANRALLVCAPPLISHLPSPLVIGVFDSSSLIFSSVHGFYFSPPNDKLRLEPNARWAHDPGGDVLPPLLILTSPPNALGCGDVDTLAILVFCFFLENFLGHTFYRRINMDRSYVIFASALGAHLTSPLGTMASSLVASPRRATYLLFRWLHGGNRLNRQITTAASCAPHHVVPAVSAQLSPLWLQGRERLDVQISTASLLALRSRMYAVGWECPWFPLRPRSQREESMASLPAESDDSLVMPVAAAIAPFSSPFPQVESTLDADTFPVRAEAPTGLRKLPMQFRCAAILGNPLLDAYHDE